MENKNDCVTVLTMSELKRIIAHMKKNGNKSIVLAGYKLSNITKMEFVDFDTILNGNEEVKI
jgi:hypothetical protein